ncbi:hypothetical protein FGU71_12260 [Erythrobacter insulae]|uniref:DUF378 domain-containing protein n=1 Tax=Erythrobacter insulae TaxID=2584124 RepID=A0A547PEI7_9SPHN|nr:hypothetical protein FGU71_12260 [Erythrobacter insulae]
MGRSLIRHLLQITGIALFVSGVVWMLQGFGILMWPQDSFMFAQREWALYGAITAAIGAIFILISRRIDPRD